MPTPADFIFDILSDAWDDYAEREQISTLWDGYLELASDLTLQLMQAHMSASIIECPVFRSYRWGKISLGKTSLPESFQAGYPFAFYTGNEDIISLPILRDTVFSEEPEDFIALVTSSATGYIETKNTLIDTMHPFPAEVREGDFVRFTSGAALTEEDTNARFQIVRKLSSTAVQLDADDIASTGPLTYTLERSTSLYLVEGVHHTVSDGGIVNFPGTSLSDPQTGDVGFSPVTTKEFSGTFVRDDPRLISEGGRAVVTTGPATVIGTGSMVGGSRIFSDTTVDFVAAGVASGDYLVIRPSGALPSQVLTKDIVSLVYTVSTNSIEHETTAPFSSNNLQYEILRPTVEDFDLVSTEEGTDEHPYSFAYKSVASSDPAGTGASITDDELTDAGLVSPAAERLIGRALIVLSFTAGSALEMSPFTVTAYDGATTLTLDRALITPATGVTYVIGDVLSIDLVEAR